MESAHMQIKDPRQQLDHMLRQTRNNLVSFSQMADTKAQVLLSISSLLLSLSLAKVSDKKFTLSITALMIFLLITIFLALLSVIGKVKVVNRIQHSIQDPDYSPLFFGNYGDVPHYDYAKNLAEDMNDSNATY